MSSPDGFRRCDGFAGSVPQNFINANLPVCPMCGSADPYWTLKDKLEFTAHRILFRCKDCGCVISATQDDFSGTTKSTAYAVLTTGGAMNALIKKKQGKDVKTVYMKVEDAGTAQTSDALVGKELPIEEFKAMAAALSGAAPVAPAVPAEPVEPAAPVTEPEIKVTYAAPTPAPAPAPTAPAPKYVAPAAPVAPAPKAKKKKAPIASIVFAILALLGHLGSMCSGLFSGLLGMLQYGGGIEALTRGFDVITTVCNFFVFVGMVLFIIGLFLHAKKGSVLCGAGLCCAAVSSLIMLLSGGGFIFVVCDLLTVCFLAIAAVFYFTGVKALGMPLKLIFGILAIFCAMISSVAIARIMFVNFAQIWTGASHILDWDMFVRTIENLITFEPGMLISILAKFLGAFNTVLFYISVILFTPKKVK